MATFPSAHAARHGQAGPDLAASTGVKQEMLKKPWGFSDFQLEE